MPAVIVILWLLFAVHSNASAKTFPLPSENQAVVGQVEEIRVKASDTLLDVARRYGIGLNEIVAANPDVDPWLPDDNQVVILPGLFILPDAPREGIVVNLPEMRLYFYPPAQQDSERTVITYPLGIGSEGRAISLMDTEISEKKIKPSWQVPESIRAEHAAEGDILPRVVPPGEDNPLGEYAMRLGQGSYLIHGTNKPYSIGMRVSHGCLRMYPEDIAVLFPQVAEGTPVHVIDQPYKVGWRDTTLFLEAHPPMAESRIDMNNNLRSMIRAVTNDPSGTLDSDSWSKALQVADQSNGVPRPIYAQNENATESGEESTTPVIKPREWMVQVGAYRKMETVNKISASISAIELPTVLSAFKKSGVCRVMTGPFSNRTLAESAADKLVDSLDMIGIIIPASRFDSSYPCQTTSQ